MADSAGLDGPWEALRLGVEAIRDDVRCEVTAALEQRSFPFDYAERLLEMLGAFVAVAGSTHEVLYARGLREGAESATFLEGAGLRPNDVSSLLARIRTPVFFERLPELVDAEWRALVVQAVAIFIAGYVRGLHVTDDVTSRRQLGIAVRRLSTATSLEQLEQGLLRSCIDLAEVDFAYVVRRSGGRWQLRQNPSMPDPPAFSLDDETLATLACGESVAGYDDARGSTLALPIIVDGELDAALIAGYRRRRPFDSQTLATLEILTSQAAATSREMGAVLQLRAALQRQREIALALQRAFVPRRFPVIHDLRFDGLYVPAENDALVGGDWYDVYEQADGVVAFSVGDVTGHGVLAAATMHQVRQAIFIASLDDSEPVRVLEKVNRGMITLESGIATAVVGFIDRNARRIRYAVAGHPAPIGVRNGNATLLPYGGLPLGVDASPQWLCHEFRWEDQRPASIVLYTDGLIENTLDAVAGEVRLCRALATAALASPLVGGEATAVYRNVVGSSGAKDDVAVLIIQLRSLSHLSSDIPAGASGLAEPAGR